MIYRYISQLVTCCYSMLLYIKVYVALIVLSSTSVLKMS